MGGGKSLAWWQTRAIGGAIAQEAVNAARNIRRILGTNDPCLDDRKSTDDKYHVEVRGRCSNPFAMPSFSITLDVEAQENGQRLSAIIDGRADFGLVLNPATGTDATPPPIIHSGNQACATDTVDVGEVREWARREVGQFVEKVKEGKARPWG
jgi:hypothetical protein